MKSQPVPQPPPAPANNKGMMEMPTVWELGKQVKGKEQTKAASTQVRAVEVMEARNAEFHQETQSPSLQLEMC